jgi:hypothetical protein
MDTDRLTIPITCPACHDTIALPTASRYEYGRQVVAIDSKPLHDHIRERHPEKQQAVTVRLDNADARYTPAQPSRPTMASEELPDRCCGCVGSCCNCGEAPCSTS